MRLSIKRQLIEMVEYIEFPTGIYIYETGKVIAFNKMAINELNGTSCQNINLLWENQKKVKLPQEVLDGESRIYFGKEVLLEKEVRKIDIEFNVIYTGTEHIVIVFFEQSYKEPFRTDLYRLLPGLIWKTADGRYATVNEVAQKGLERYVKERDSKDSDNELITRMVEEVQASERTVLETKKGLFCQIEQTDFEKIGSGLLKLNRLPILGKKEEYIGLLIISNSILTEMDYQKMFQNVLHETAMLRECVMRENRIAIGIGMEPEMLVHYATPNIASLGYSVEQIVAQQCKWSEIVYPDDLQRVQDEIAQAIEQNVKSLKQTYRIYTAEGKVIWVNMMLISPYSKTDEAFKRFLLEVSQEEQEEVLKPYVVMKKDTYLDYLTGLPNRMKYEEDAEFFIQEAVNNKKKGYILVLDLDDFRNVNEAFGPEYGDILLKKIAQELNDIPEVENYCYRVDGDEFLLFVRGEYCKDVENIIQQCLKLFNRNWKLVDKECFCSVSIGVTEYPRDSVRPRELLKYADAAVYEAKRKGKNRIQHYKKAVLNSSLERVNYEKYLRKAIAKGCVEFDMHFQPIVLSSTKEVMAAEALVRWYSPELGFISPMNFISLSEYLGLIVPLGEYVLRKTFLTCKKWNDTINPDFKVSVNLSIVQLVQPNIVDRIMEIARITQVNTRNVVLEVTESLAVEDMGLMKKVLQRLKDYGFSIALDDFGTGYSSLNHIMEMPLDYVKVDKSFVSGYGTEHFNPGLISAIIQLAHSVNMEVVVEGVETKQQMEFLMFYDTDKMQGYLFGKPMPVEQFEKEVFQKDKDSV